MSQLKTLVIAEKPSVGRDIARVLKCNQKVNGGIEGSQYVVTWGLGHLVTLSDPEHYDNKYKEWNMAYLPMIPKHIRLEIMKQTNKQYQAVKTFIHRNDIKNIVIATDAGREGELVARWILEKAGNKKPMKRLWISSVTDKAIREGFSNLKDSKAYDNLYRAAVSRAEADWLVGINATRALTCKYNAQLSCGRVQTPTLAMIAKREEEIRQFKSKPYYGIKIKARTSKNEVITFLWKDNKSSNNHSFDKAYIENRIKELQSLGNKTSNHKIQGTIADIKKSLKKTYAQNLYDLTELQRDANKRYDYSAKETLNIMQRLYENHKVLTYPRTDSRYITKDVFETIPERLESCATGPYKKFANTLLHKKLTPNANVVDNSKVSDHHAIIPTEQVLQLDHMTIEERKIYDLVVKRFLSVLYPPYEYEQTSVQIKVGNEVFYTKGKIVRNLGWKEIYENQTLQEEESEENNDLPELQKNETLTIESIQMTEGKTEPPALFNEATLLSAMENPVKYMESKDKSDIKMLGETGGLGTVATRADIIEKLFHSFLIEKRGKDIYLTSKGKQLLGLVPEDLKKPELTADWEKKLQKIANGSLQRDLFMNEIKSYTTCLVDEIKKAQGQFRHDNLTNHKCPQCGKKMLLVKGKNSKLHVCQDRECGYRETIARTSNARCPKCHKKMELTGQKEAQVFLCACGYKEKLSAFQERRKKEGAGVSKKDVNRYINQLKKEEEPLNNAFAEALAKLKK